MNIQSLLNDLDTTVYSIKHLTSSIQELVLYAPAMACHFHPGQFFRFQDEKPRALTGIEATEDYLTLIVFGLSLSLKQGDKIPLMGPLGTPTFIPENENILLIGEGFGTMSLLSIAKAMRKKNCKVSYIASYRNEEECIKKECIEESADEVIWCFKDEEHSFSLRPQDQFLKGSLIDAFYAYRHHFKLYDRSLIIASMDAAKALQGMLDFFQKTCVMLTGVHVPMHCMMKGICAKCLLRHQDGAQTSYIYSCAHQDQNLRTLDFDCLNTRRCYEKEILSTQKCLL